VKNIDETVKFSPSKGDKPAFRLNLPGRIIGAEGENVVIIELETGGRSIIDGNRIHDITPHLSPREREELFEKCERMITLEIIKSSILVS